MSDINIEDHDEESPLRVVLDSYDLGVERDMEETRIRSRSASRGRIDSSSSRDSSSIRESRPNIYPVSDWDVAYPTPSVLPAVPVAPFGGVSVLCIYPQDPSPNDSEDSWDREHNALPDGPNVVRHYRHLRASDAAVVERIYVPSRTPSVSDDGMDAPVLPSPEEAMSD